MNQILDYSQNTNKAPSQKSFGGGGGYNPKPSRNDSGSDKIVRVFAIILIIFAVAVIGIALSSKLSNDETIKEEKEEKKQEKAVIELIADEEESTLKINITHTKNIEKVIYKWGTNREKELKSQGGMTFTEEISLPNGENTLTIKVIDAEGNETFKEEVFTTSTGVDITPPQLSLVPEGNKLVITAKDEKEISMITYKWSSDEETTEVHVDEEGKTELVTEVEIQRGENDILVTAVDKAGNISTDTRTYKGVTLPEVVVTVSVDGTQANVNVTHEVGIQSINIVLNGESYDIEELDGTQTDVSVDFEIDPNIENKLAVTAVSIEGTESKKEETIVYEGNNGPVIEVVQDGPTIHVLFKAEAGILKAELFMQEQSFMLDGLDGNPKEASLDLDLPEGTNRLIFTMTDMNGDEAVYDQELTR